jgi:hypothetical protein
MITSITDALTQVRGVVAVVLGGSRATNVHTKQSDYDIGIYYDEHKLDLAGLQTCAAALDDAHRTELITGPGGWGDWVNGGGWLTVNEAPVDLILRDVRRVSESCTDAHSGNLKSNYQIGHPHAFLNTMYAGELACATILWSADERIPLLKQSMLPYPLALKQAIVQFFLFEANFSLSIAEKYAKTDDTYYVMAHLVRSISACNQVFFALNERYCLNEKHAVRAIQAMPLRPNRYTHRIDAVLSSDGLGARCAALRALLDEANRFLLT